MESSKEILLQKVAKIVGFLFLFIMGTAMYNEFYVRSKLVVAGNALQTFENIRANEALFRIGVASELLTTVCIAALVLALFVLLREVNKNIALLALFFRGVEVVVFAIIVLNSFVVLRLVNGSTSYFGSMDQETLSSWTLLFIMAHSNGYDIAVVFFGLGSLLFSYLLYSSRYVPKIISGLGIFSALTVVICTFVMIVAPNTIGTLSPMCYLPITIFEVYLGAWLLIKGVKIS
ncbi:DUF4386 domain-containing protein [Flagellimonas lutimaris]|uniref:DUF4386 domain-containing protein n=1 Tax=Flagellimonas lutimaris TaxID=475082 RepID=UPI003F5CC11F